MIPKIIHYCWFGRNPLPELALKCIASWKKFCPDYEIREWNESNFDVNSIPYMKEAYEEKAWAFVSDVARLQIVFEYGGIYLDTDVEVIKPLDDLLINEAFMGRENDEYVNSGLGFGAIVHHPLMGELLDDYMSLHFRNPDGSLNKRPCPQIQTETLLRHGLIQKNTKQILSGITVYPTDYFCPIDYHTGICAITENTHTVHHFAASWHDGWERFNEAIPSACVRIFGVRYGMIIGRVLSLPSLVVYKFYMLGGKETLKVIMRKLRNRRSI